jgi:N-methylhydantoinase A/oxoprolinase/acetone carboxylase beta subunit
MRRIGIDVGGTNTDAVLLKDGRVVHAMTGPARDQDANHFGRNRRQSMSRTCRSPTSLGTRRVRVRVAGEMRARPGDETSFQSN